MFINNQDKSSVHLTMFYETFLSIRPLRLKSITSMTAPHIDADYTAPLIT